LFQSRAVGIENLIATVSIIHERCARRWFFWNKDVLGSQGKKIHDSGHAPYS